MFPATIQHIRLIQDTDGYIRVYDTADWRVILENLQDAAGQPLDLTGAILRMQIRPESLPNKIIDTLVTTNGITVSSGPTITLVSKVINRVWRARETTNLVGDLMMERLSGDAMTVTFLTRIHFVVQRGSTQP